MSRKRPNKPPEYIQLQPYRALVGVPISRGRAGTIAAFFSGAIKGALVSVIPVVAAVTALAYFTQGWDDLETAITSGGALAAILVGGIGLTWGVLTAARR